MTRTASRQIQIHSGPAHLLCLARLACLPYLFVAMASVLPAICLGQSASGELPAFNRPENEKRILQARTSGYWVVEEGERLHRICRYFYPGDRVKMERLCEYLFQRNKAVFLNGEQNMMIVGSRLYLPRELVFDAGVAQRPAGTAIPAPPPQQAQTQVPSPPDSVAPAVSPATPAQPRQPPIEAEPAYIDKLIEGMRDDDSQSAQEALDQTPGQRFLALDYRLESRHPPSGGQGVEQALDLRYKWETLNYGDFFLDAGMRHLVPAPGDILVGKGNGGRFTLYQNHFPLTEGWLADSAIGTLRTPPNPLINSSYRIFLPSSLMEGVSSIISDPSHELRFYSGKLGVFAGSVGQGFDTTSGGLTGLGYSRRLGSEWNVGGEMLSLRGNTFIRDHESASAAAEFISAIPGTRHKIQLVSDSESHLGGWYDGDLSVGRSRFRFGIFQIDPDLLWGDSPIQQDTRGAYFRTDYRAVRYTLSLGADLTQNNIRNNPAKTKTDVASVYETTTLRLDRNLSFGAGLTYQGTRTSYSATPDSNTISGNLFLSWNNAVGLSRFDISRFLTRSVGLQDNTIDTFSWSQDFSTFSNIGFNTTLNHSRERGQGSLTRRTSLGLALRGLIMYDLSWNSNLVLARVQSDLGTEENVNVSASALWNFARNWTAQAQLSLNSINPAPALPGTTAPPFQRDKRFLLGVRYDAASGTPYQTLGLKSGAGSGRISGQVFFDENADGLRQPTEKGAQNVTVYLDGRYPATTDSEGRFSFPIVAPGSHKLRIANESLPLPWTVDDDRPLSANVPLRGDAVIDIPLTRIRP